MLQLAGPGSRCTAFAYGLEATKRLRCAIDSFKRYAQRWLVVTCIVVQASLFNNFTSKGET